MKPENDSSNHTRTEVTRKEIKTEPIVGGDYCRSHYNSQLYINLLNIVPFCIFRDEQTLYFELDCHIDIVANWRISRYIITVRITNISEIMLLHYRLSNNNKLSVSYRLLPRYTYPSTTYRNIFNDHWVKGHYRYQGPLRNNFWVWTHLSTILKVHTIGLCHKWLIYFDATQFFNFFSNKIIWHEISRSCPLFITFTTYFVNQQLQMLRNDIIY